MASNWYQFRYGGLQIEVCNGGVSRMKEWSGSESRSCESGVEVRVGVGTGASVGVRVGVRMRVRVTAGA